MAAEVGMEVETAVEEGEGEGELTWKVLFLRRVGMAADHCHNLHGLLRGLYAVLDGKRWRDMAALAEEARRKLEGASTELALAITNMGAARHLALRGGRTPSPTGRAPIPSSIDDLTDPAAQRALGRLQDAAERASRLHDWVESARVHLAAAALLLKIDVDDGGDDAPCPWVQNPCASEQQDGVMALAEALSQTVDLVALVASASRDEAL